MIKDTMLQFSTAQTFTATGDTVSTNILDTGATQDEGIGHESYLVVKTVASVTGTSSTVAPVLQTSADNSTWVDALVGPSSTTTIAANTELWKTRLPIGLRRYIRVAYRVGTAVLTAGSFDAFIVENVQAYQYGASGFTVDV